MRYYTHADATIALRKSGTSGGLQWLLGDRQGSVSIAVNADTPTITRDRYLPYGGNRSTAWTLPTDKGWLGQTQDKDTGLTYLNARYYDPNLAHFVSADLLNDQSSSQHANPYTYAADNPITYSDPSGLVAKPIYRRIRANDTLTSIAKGHNVTVRKLLEMNPGVKSKALRVGFTLQVGWVSGGPHDSAGKFVQLHKPTHPKTGVKTFNEARRVIDSYYTQYPSEKRRSAAAVGMRNNGEVGTFVSESTKSSLIEQLENLGIPVFQIRGAHKDISHAERAMERWRWTGGNETIPDGAVSIPICAQCRGPVKDMSGIEPEEGDRGWGRGRNFVMGPGGEMLTAVDLFTSYVLQEQLRQHGYTVDPVTGQVSEPRMPD